MFFLPFVLIKTIVCTCNEVLTSLRSVVAQNPQKRPRTKHREKQARCFNVCKRMKTRQC